MVQTNDKINQILQVSHLPFLMKNQAKTISCFLLLMRTSLVWTTGHKGSNKLTGIFKKF